MGFDGVFFREFRKSVVKRHGQMNGESTKGSARGTEERGDFGREDAAKGGSRWGPET